MTAARVGIDVGGTAIKLGVVRAEGEDEILGEAEFDLPSSPELGEVLTEAGHRARELADEFVGVGVGLPGLLDREAGKVEASPNLPWLEGRPVREMLAERFDLPADRIHLENDGNVAAMGELWRGAGRGCEHLVMATLGTGIGGGLILNGALFVGQGLAGEVGHIVLDPDGPPCGCGGRGCLEQYASATAAGRRAKARGLPSAAPGDLKLLSKIAGERPGPERDLLEEIGADLGHGFAQVLQLLDVRTYVVGGGFGRALDALLPGIRRGLGEWAYGAHVGDIRIVPAELGSRAGWIGAARLVEPN